MKLTYKQIARSAGYVAYQQYSSSGNTWHWTDKLGSNEASKVRFSTEEKAYEDCCFACKLVEETI